MKQIYIVILLTVLAFIGYIQIVHAQQLHIDYTVKYDLLGNRINPAFNNFCSALSLFHKASFDNGTTVLIPDNETQDKLNGY